MNREAVQARRYLIEGMVQGVGFRFFVLRRALAAGLNGWVRNLADGRVEVYAEGAGKDLRALEEDLRRGPRGARIGRIDITEEAATSLRDGFRIR